jgi:EmrB/QacA subfamily drug resistance transporter
MIESAKPRPLHESTILVVTSISAFLTPFNSASVNIALPAIGIEFQADAITLSWVSTSLLLATAIFLVPLGRLADIHGMKKMMVAGLVIYIFSSIMAAVSGNMALLMTARVLQGLASAMIFSTSTALLVLAYPVEQRGRVLGINIACVYIGLSLGPFVGGVLTQTLGWRSIFWLIAALVLVPIVMTFWLIKEEWAAARGEKFDLAGSLIYGTGLIALMFGLSELPDWWGYISIAASILVLAGFVAWEMRAKSPLINVYLFIRNRVFGFSNLAALINYAATFAVTFLLSLYLQYIKEMEPGTAGLVILVMPLVQAIFSPVMGKLSDKVDPRFLASAGMGLCSIGLLMLALLNSGMPLLYIIASLVILGLGFAFFSSPNTNAIMSSVGKGSLATASATLATMRLIGQMLSMGVAMLAMSVIIGHLEIEPPVYPQFELSVKICFIIFTVLCFGGIFASLARGNSNGIRGNNANEGH